jgi:hypothetical protein
MQPSRWTYLVVSAIGAIACGTLHDGLVSCANAQDKSSELPWKKPQGAEQPLSFRELMEPIGFDDEYWAGYRYSNILDSDSTLQALRLLDRLSAFTPDQWSGWRVELPEAPLAIGDRGRVYSVQGRATAVSGPYLLADQGLQGFRIGSYYTADIRINEDSAAVCRVLCQHVPKAWLAAKKLDERCEMDGVFLVSAADGPRWFAANRLRWYADDQENDQRIKVPQAWQFLGRHGVDMGRVESLQLRNQQSLNGGEREVFYPTLRLLDRLPDDWETVPSTPWSLTDVLRAPRDYQGQRLKGQVTARRVTKVLIDDPAITRRLGIDAYYQVDVFFPLDGTKIRLTAPGKESTEDAPVYSNGYPGTVVCLTLPKKLAVAAQKVLDGTAKTQLIQVPLEVDGIFLKIWSYHSPFLTRGENEQTHPSPLIVAAELRALDPPQIGKSSVFSTFILVGFIFLFSGALALGWWANRGGPPKK